MGLKIKIGDIVCEKVDAIVNSMGVDGNIMGKICLKIVEASKSTELKNFIISKVNNQISDIFLTKGYRLPSKNIIHLVTPFRKDDDENCTKLKQAITKVIEFAKANNYKTLSIPFIGMGFNGYSRDESFNSIYESSFDYIDDKQIKINIIMYFGTKTMNRTLSNDVLVKANPIYKEAQEFKRKNTIKQENDLQDNEVYKSIKQMGKVNPNSFFDCDYENYTKPFDFIEEYCLKHDFKLADRSSKFFDHRKIYQRKNKSKLTNLESYILGFILGFNETEMNEFLIICGLSYSPLSKIDLYFRDYFSGKRGEHILSADDLIDDYYKFCHQSLPIDNFL